MFFKHTDKSVQLGNNNDGIVITGDENTVNYYNQAFFPDCELSERDKKRLRKKLTQYFYKLRIHNSSTFLSATDYQQLDIKDYKNNQIINEDELVTNINQDDDIELLIIGDIGSGKTTLMKHIIYKYLNSEILNKYNMVFYIDLKIMNETVENIQDLLYFQYRQFLNNLQKCKFTFEEETTLFIFDGVDKIKSDELRKKFYYIQNSLDNKIIISRNNSFDINQLSPTRAIVVNGFKNRDDIKNTYFMQQQIESTESEFIKYLVKLFSLENNVYNVRDFLSVISFVADEGRDSYIFKSLSNPLIVNILYLFYIKKKKEQARKNYNFFILDKFEFFEYVVNFFIIEYQSNLKIEADDNLETFLGRVKKPLYLLAEIASKDNNYINQGHGLPLAILDNTLGLGFIKSIDSGNQILTIPYRFVSEFFIPFFMAEKIYIDHTSNQCIIEEILDDLCKFEKYQESIVSDIQSYKELYNILNVNYHLDILIFLNKYHFSEDVKAKKLLADKFMSIYDSLKFEYKVEILYDLQIDESKVKILIPHSWRDEVNEFGNIQLYSKLDELKKIYSYEYIEEIKDV